MRGTGSDATSAILKSRIILSPQPRTSGRASRWTPSPRTPSATPHPSVSSSSSSAPTTAAPSVELSPRSALRQLENYLGPGFSFQSSDFDHIWNNKEELDAEFADLFPNGQSDPDAGEDTLEELFPDAELMIRERQSSCDGDHDYARTDNDAVMSSAAAPEPTLTQLLNADPVLTSSADPIIDAPIVSSSEGLLTMPQFDFDLEDVDEQSNDAQSNNDEDSIMYSDSEEEKEEKEAVQAASNDVIIVKQPKNGPAAAATKKNRRRKPKANAWSREVQPRVSAAVAKIGAKGRPRLYDQRPFSDPELERCRLNAICAKQNRDRKRQEKQQMEREVVELRSENKKLKRAAESSSKQLKRAEDQLRRMRELLAGHGLDSLLEMARCAGNHADTARARANCKACSLDCEE